jgi:hypothetical protein
MNERRIEQPARYSDVPLQPVLRIEYGDVEFLDRKIFEFLGEELVDISRPPNGSTFLTLLGCHPPAKLQRRMYPNRTSRSYPRDARKRGNRLRREQPE